VSQRRVGESHVELTDGLDHEAVEAQQQPFETVAPPAFPPAQQVGGQQRDHRDRHYVRRDERDRQRDRKRPKDGLDKAADEDDRDQHHDRGVRAREDRQHDLFGPADHGVVDVRSLLVVVALDVLDHDDGVVEQHSYREDDRGQRDHVEFVSDEPHHREREQVRKGNRDGGQRHASQVGEKQEHYQYRHDYGVAQRAQHVVDGQIDDRSLGVGDAEGDVGVHPLEFRQGPGHIGDRV
jgi:hypothetical protein